MLGIFWLRQISCTRLNYSSLVFSTNLDTLQKINVRGYIAAGEKVKPEFGIHNNFFIGIEYHRSKVLY